MMHSTATVATSRPGGRGLSTIGAALLAIAGNVLVVAILAVGAIVALGAAVVVFGGEALGLI